jgi:hypothetical protein
MSNVPSLQTVITLMMKEKRSSETSVLKIATQHNIPEDGILQSHRRENLKPFIFTSGTSPS